MVWKIAEERDALGVIGQRKEPLSELRESFTLNNPACGCRGRGQGLRHGCHIQVNRLQGLRGINGNGLRKPVFQRIVTGTIAHARRAQQGGTHGQSQCCCGSVADC